MLGTFFNIIYKKVILPRRSPPTPEGLIFMENFEAGWE